MKIDGFRDLVLRIRNPQIFRNSHIQCGDPDPAFSDNADPNPVPDPAPVPDPTEFT
jgi:hypothetical protein